MPLFRARKDAVRAAGVCALTAFLAAALSGCAARMGTPDDPYAYSAERFMAEAIAQAPSVPVDDLVVPFRVTPEMVAKARDVIRGHRSDYQRAQALMESITADDGFGLHYEAVATATPDVTLERGYGNCLALTSMFIGLAREIGLTAYYVDASDRINDLRQEEGLIVDSGHIAGGVRTERGYTLIDYDGHASDYRTFKIIDDITALAHYYNNLGFERITEARRSDVEVPWEDIGRLFELATKVRPDFAHAYNNLGVAHRKLGDLDAAESAYLAAIAVDDEFDAAHHNLGNLRMKRGDVEGAIEAYDVAMRLRGRNPFLHYHRGIAQYRLNDLVAAEKSFKKAISQKRDYIEARNLLAQVYTMTGRPEEAEKIRAAVRLILAEQRKR